MGIIVKFPEGQRPAGTGRSASAHSEPAVIIILPVVRIERGPDKPFDGLESGAPSGRRRKRRASRS